MLIKELKVLLAASQKAEFKAREPFRKEQERIQKEIEKIRNKRGYVSAYLRRDSGYEYYEEGRSTPPTSGWN